MYARLLQFLVNCRILQLNYYIIINLTDNQPFCYKYKVMILFIYTLKLNVKLNHLFNYRFVCLYNNILPLT